MRVIAIIQARLGSKRLPDKVLLPVFGLPLVEVVAIRAKMASLVDDVIIAIPDNKENHVLANYLLSKDIKFIRGDEHDVLGRFLYSATATHADVIVRLTADDPFKEPGIIDEVVSRILLGFDYVSNNLKPSFPEGLDVEAFTYDALVKADKLATKNYEREHVTPYIWESPDRFNLCNVLCEQQGFENVRLTIDDKVDFELISNFVRTFCLDITSKFSDYCEYLNQEPYKTDLRGRIQRNYGLTISRNLDD